MDDWDNARKIAARALAGMQARENVARQSGTSFSSALIEAIVDLDSGQAGSVETLGRSDNVSFSDDGQVRPGQLQHLDLLDTTFFGSDATGQEGLITRMQALSKA